VRPTFPQEVSTGLGDGHPASGLMTARTWTGNTTRFHARVVPKVLKNFCNFRESALMPGQPRSFQWGAGAPVRGLKTGMGT
jgi:hypothetical protein